MTESDGPHDETPWRSLHPASLFVNLIPQAWRTVRGAWPFLLAIAVGGARDPSALFNLSLIGFFFLAALARSAVHVATLRYRVVEGKLELRAGLLNRRAQVIDAVRIQNVSIERNIFHRMSGLVELKVDTAGGGGTEGLLSALSVGEAEGLKAELQAAHDRKAPEEPNAAAVPTDVLTEMGLLECLAYGFTNRSVGAVALLTAVMLEGMARMGPSGGSELAAATRQPRAILAAVLIAFAASWLLSAGNALLRHHRCRLSLEKERLVVEEGLFTRRRVEIPIGKVQVVLVDETFLRRRMGYGTLQIETAALGVMEGPARQAEGRVPMVPLELLSTCLSTAIPTLPFDPWEAPLLPAHRRAFHRATLQRTLNILLLSLVAAAFVGGWGALGLTLLPTAPLLAWLDWRSQGWLITPEVLVIRRGWLSRTTCVIDRNKLQSVHLSQSPLLRLNGLGRVVVRVAGTELALPDLSFEEAQVRLQSLRD